MGAAGRIHGHPSRCSARSCLTATASVGKQIDMRSAAVVTMLLLAAGCARSESRITERPQKAAPAPRPAISGGVYPSPYQHPVYIFPPKRGRDEPVRDPATPPVPRSTPRPAYPASALRARISGVVIMDIVIDRSGRVSGYSVLKRLPFGVSEAAIEAVRRWRYTPGRDANGNPVASIIRVTVPFNPPSP